MFDNNIIIYLLENEDKSLKKNCFCNVTVYVNKTVNYKKYIKIE